MVSQFARCNIVIKDIIGKYHHVTVLPRKLTLRCQNLQKNNTIIVLDAYKQGRTRVMVFEIRGFAESLSTGRKEGNALFNDALNTFYLRLYGVGHMIKDHSDSKRGNSLSPHGLLLPISSKGYFIPRPLLHQSWSTGWKEK